MADPIFSRDWLLRQYDEARNTLDPVAAVEHVAGVTGLDLATVEAVIWKRESLHSAAEVA